MKRQIDLERECDLLFRVEVSTEVTDLVKLHDYLTELLHRLAPQENLREYLLDLPLRERVVAELEKIEARLRKVGYGETGDIIFQK